MAEGRMLKRNISNSRRLASLKTDAARMLWTWIIPYLDVEGRFYASPDLIKGKVVPRIKTFTEKNISEYMEDMARVGLIVLYENDGELYLEYRKFSDHQIGLRKDREAKSHIPAPGRKPLKADVWKKAWDDFKASDHICKVCGKQGALKVNEYVIDGYIPFEIDHIIPLSLGGTDENDNLRIICRTCNRSKNNTPEQLRSNSGVTPPEIKLREVKLSKDKAQKFVLPTWCTPKLWDAYLEVRKKKRATLEETALSLSIKNIEKLAVDTKTRVLILEQSIQRGWVGFFELKEDKHGQGFKRDFRQGDVARPDPPAEAIDAIERARERKRLRDQGAHKPTTNPNNTNP